MSVDPERRKAFDELEATIQQRMKLIRDNVQLHKTEGSEAVRAFLIKGEGKQVMDRIRLQIDQMDIKERAALAIRNRESRISYWTALITGLITALLGLAMAIAAYVLVSRDFEKRQLLSEALQKSKERLEERVQARTQEIRSSNDALRG